MATGSGIGTPISGIPALTIDAPSYVQTAAVPLYRYAQLVGHEEAAFWGVQRANTDPTCSMIWTKYQREQVARALLEAQYMIEGELNYPIVPTWVTGTPGGDPRLFDEEVVRSLIHTQWCMVIAPGVRGQTALATADVGYGTEPTTITASVGTATADEIHVYYPGTTQRIYPDSVSVSSGTATIRIPRARLVSDHENNESGWDFDDSTLFLDQVDVARIYTDDSDHATMRRVPGQCDVAATQTAQITIRDYRLGFIEIMPANYTAGAWVRASCAGSYQYVGLNYRAGLNSLPFDFETMIVRLAHTLLPEEPCGCPKVSHLWHRDRATPDILTAERLNCPFGMSNGAWQVYKFAMTKRILRGMTL